MFDAMPRITSRLWSLDRDGSKRKCVLICAAVIILSQNSCCWLILWDLTTVPRGRLLLDLDLGGPDEFCLELLPGPTFCCFGWLAAGRRGGGGGGG